MDTKISNGKKYVYTENQSLLFDDHTSIILNDICIDIYNRFTMGVSKIVINEFTVAPKFSTDNTPSYHEWFVDFDSEAVDLEGFEQDLDLNMQSQNKYYQDLIQGKVIKSLKIRRVSKNGFSSYMDSIGKLGGQNKIPKISNDRKIADQLYKQDLVIKG